MPIDGYESLTLDNNIMDEVRRIVPLRHFKTTTEYVRHAIRKQIDEDKAKISLEVQQ